MSSHDNNTLIAMLVSPQLRHDNLHELDGLTWLPTNYMSHEIGLSWLSMQMSKQIKNLGWSKDKRTWSFNCRKTLMTLFTLKIKTFYSVSLLCTYFEKTICIWRQLRTERRSPYPAFKGQQNLNKKGKNRLPERKKYQKTHKPKKN
jgi:hypothetical protein